MFHQLNSEYRPERAEKSESYEEIKREIIELMPALKAFSRTFCRNPSDAEDLVQTTLTKALANIDKFKPGTKLKSWMFTIMHNAFCTQAKKSARERTLGGNVIVDTVGKEATQEWTVRGGELLSALERVPYHYRQVFVLIIIEGESYIETARITGCPIGTVKSRLNRARQLLVDQLDGGL
ncbi:sigma-70 family RNA polymerase sigma factor [Rhizobium sp. L1K21]|uniref:sigma-70 family RNA polymerase sigma factor n=1 Tax=Rhizobium sp. L1K21 TaxID=2954933 RepID=UPI0020937F0D|nr:sigma-70 family RNA polymerase sigma factor [Rhizobium sp. L1K21]MCO6187804.1 sigma-70 family RNA polymerase sigma factor [Rhizobium sp. L1K21]